jgi:hypothetical protein
MPDRRALLIGVLAFVAVAAVLWVPWATKTRVVIASTPVPPPLFGFTPAPLEGGQTGCIQTVTFSPQTQIGEMAIATKGGPGPALDITAKAPGYSAKAQIPAGYVVNDGARFNLTAPSKEVIGDLCIRNTGKQTVILNSTNEFRTMGRPQLVIGGQVQPMDPKLVFYARGQGSYLSRAGQILRHAAIFTPPFLPRVVLALLGLVALVGIPLAMALAFIRADAADRETD